MSQPLISKDEMAVGQGIVEYYLTKLYDPKVDHIVRKMQAELTTQDPEWVETQVRAQANEFKEEMAEKFNSVMCLVIKKILMGHLTELRFFEMKLMKLLTDSFLRDEAVGIPELIKEFINLSSPPQE